MIDILNELKKQNEELVEFLHKLTIKQELDQKELHDFLSNLQKKETRYLRIIIKRRVEEAEVIAAPRVNEMFLCQSISTNGIVNKSPAYTLRTNTGYLIAAVLKEGIGLEVLNDRIAIMAGETLSIEPEAAGTIDMTLSVIRVPMHKDFAENFISEPAISNILYIPSIETPGENKSIERILD